MGIFRKKDYITEQAAVTVRIPAEANQKEDCLIDFEIRGTVGKTCYSTYGFWDTSVFDKNSDTDICAYDALCKRLAEAGSRPVLVTWEIQNARVKRCYIDVSSLAEAFGEPWLAELEELGWKIVTK